MKQRAEFVANNKETESSMSTLKVDKLKCVQTTSGLGSDQIYMVVVIGRRSGAKNADLKIVHHSQWDSLSPGETRNEDATVDAAYQPNDFYLGALVERDGDQDVLQVDFPGPTIPWLEPVEFHMNEVWQAWGVNVQGLTDDQIAAKLIHTMNSLVGGAGDDDLVGSARLLPKPKAGQSVMTTFAGDGGKYQATFKVVN
jgi:hypothetical protein